MPYVVTGTAFVVRRVSNTTAFEWFGPNQDNPQGSGDYSNALAHYSAANDTTYSIHVETFSSLDTGLVSGEWTRTSAIHYGSY